MKKKSTLTAIDVGTTKVCTIIADVQNSGGIRVLGVGIGPSHGMHKGLVVNIAEAREAIKESVEKAERASGHKVDSAFVGVTGRHVTCMNNKGVVAINRGDRLVRPDDLKRVMSSAQSVQVPSDRRLLHVIPRHYAVDGQEMVKNPVGMHGFRLDVETHIITAAIASVQNLVKCVRLAGLDIDELILEPLASSEAVLSKEEMDIGTILADIGGGTTDVCIFKDGSIMHTAVIPVAGYQLTRDVSIGLGLPFDVAEEMKKKYGSVMPVYDSKAETVPLAADGHGVSYRDLCDIIRARVEEIVKLIMLEIPQGEYDKIVPGGLVLTGGSAKVSGLEALGRNMLQLPVRVGAPNPVPGISEVLNDPAYATAVGLLLWGARHETRGNWKSPGLLQRMMGRLTGLFR